MIADPTLLNTRVYSNIAPGPYTVTETLPVSGWDLTALVCTGGGANTSTTLATGLSTIGLDAGENVVCTYTNTKQTTLKLVKTVTTTTEEQRYPTIGISSQQVLAALLS
jgi:hypothetical protein